uniref:Ig-like domain-containing protein n=1 Tax=Sphaeramia orbicularis TaxID=375764 RepID=A0A672ZPS8_9TELE
LRGTSLIQAAEFPRPISSTMVKFGDNTSFYCPVTYGHAYYYWYKQPLGRQIQTVAGRVYAEIRMENQFKSTRFNITENKGQYVFTIRNIRKEDEAMYFCQNGPAHGLTFMNSTFIFISMEQTPPAASVQRGHSVSLQCSLLSDNKENPVQCPDEHNVYWFRAASGGYGPGIIYTHKNKTEEPDKRKCIYRVSKTVQDLSDSGTYYCAVATCGQILFGGGTKVETGENPFGKCHKSSTGSLWVNTLYCLLFKTDNLPKNLCV